MPDRLRGGCGMNHHVSKPERARWEVKFVPGRGYMVQSPTGERHGPFACKDNAETNRDAWEAKDHRARKRITRPCLCCQKPFESEGIHNRMCDSCRRQNGELIPYGIAPRNGRPR